MILLFARITNQHRGYGEQAKRLSGVIGHQGRGKSSCATVTLSPYEQ